MSSRRPAGFLGGRVTFTARATAWQGSSPGLSVLQTPSRQALTRQSFSKKPFLDGLVSVKPASVKPVPVKPVPNHLVSVYLVFANPLSPGPPWVGRPGLLERTRRKLDSFEIRYVKSNT